MVLIHIDGSIADYELGLLTRILALLDVELSRVSAAIDESCDPESDGLCDLGEFLIGSGFVAMQRYINTIRADFGLSKKSYNNPPMLNINISVVGAINALSNYWKHCADWDKRERDGGNPATENGSADTIKSLEYLGDLGDYPCANALALMLPGQSLELSNTLKFLTEWRDGLWAERQHQ